MIALEPKAGFTNRRLRPGLLTEGLSSSSVPEDSPSEVSFWATGVLVLLVAAAAKEAGGVGAAADVPFGVENALPCFLLGPISMHGINNKSHGSTPGCTTAPRDPHLCSALAWSPGQPRPHPGGARRPAQGALERVPALPTAIYVE